MDGERRSARNRGWGGQRGYERRDDESVTVEHSIVGQTKDSRGFKNYLGLTLEEGK
jgi:hypothetical protein